MPEAMKFQNIRKWVYHPICFVQVNSRKCFFYTHTHTHDWLVSYSLKLKEQAHRKIWKLKSNPLAKDIQWYY